jgi:ATP-binding cassette subfamily F protein 3
MAAEDYEAVAEAHHLLAELQGYDAEARAGRLLHGLGFPAVTHDKPVGEFSGGWRVRLNLARALMTPSDLLLLDEPTNHLDLDAVLWLEDWLLKYPGTLLIISHDREFLDGVTSISAPSTCACSRSASRRSRLSASTCRNSLRASRRRRARRSRRSRA